ncbi:LOW QUALITY PROTEIN: IgGFc-binding protein-like [Brachyhypopomus gauderio]|uniref:LOW QUALITY PROTEIN: IgGFc-binding protein-like n=1 Tax=Brachyhypopomus gauderio TaxID=698409 RepID=UPI0040433954
MDIRMAESCVDVNSCGSYYPLWLNGPHPQLEDGVVTRQVCANAGSDCCFYKSNPIRVKACPGNFYVYEIVRPVSCNMAYCTDASTITTNPVSAAISSSSELNTTTSPSSTGSTGDPCYNYNVFDDVWRTTYSYYGYDYYSYGFSNYFSSHDDTTVEWDGWYRLYLQGEDAQISEWCVGPMSSGGYTPLILGGSHPLIEDGIVTREIYGSNTYYYYWYWDYGWDNNQCRYYTSYPIQVKACPEHYYVYKLVKPNVSIPLPTYTTVAFNSHTSYDPCNDYTSLDQPWRASTAPGLGICDVDFNWNGWYRLLYNGMDIRMAESCVDVYRCGSYYTLWLNGPHPQVEDGVVTRQVCANAGSDCCFYKSNPINVKACSGNYYVYQIVKPMTCNMAYCTDINTTSAVLEPSNAESKEALPSSEDDVTFDPCHYYDVIDDYWRNENELYSYYRGHDDTLVEWEGWYRLFLQGKSAQLSEWCVSYMTCGGYTALVLGGSHPRLEDGIVTREIYSYSNGQCNTMSRSNPIQVKACPGNYYIYKLVKPDISIPMPTYCAVSFTYPSNDPCYNYNVLDQPWRSTNNAEHNNYYYYSWWWWWSWCDKYTSWNGWYRLHYDGNDIQMPDSCVNQGMCGTDIPLWLNGSRPQLQDGVVVQQVCGSGNGDCCYYKSFPIQVKACPGNYYVYELVSPVTCNSAYCIDVNTISRADNYSGTTEPTSVVTTPPTGDITTIPTNIPFTTPAFTPVVTANATNVTVEFPRVDPCETFNELDETWRATNNTNLYQVYFPWGQSPWCDTFTNWNGWYRLLYNGADVQMSDSCVTEGKCGTYIPLWLNGSHPQVQDEAVTRQVCASWNGSCCFHESSIQVKACLGGYYVYQFVAPTICFSAYCTDFGTSTPPTTPETPTTTPETNTTPEITAIIQPTTMSTASINVEPSATCSASGDPHYTSFDGSTFDFQGTCRYILATVCNDTQGLPYFHVSARNEPWNRLPVSITVDVYVIVSGYMVHMSRNMHGAVKVDNETRNLPVLLDSGRVSIYSSGMNTFITTDFGLSVSYDGSWVARITVPGNYSGTTCGLCGNYNGQTSDDFLTSSGALETSASQFGASWRVENDTVCSDGCGDSCSSCPDQTRAQTQCEIIRDRQGPFSFCQAYVDPQAYFNDCVFDVCLSGYSNDVLCRSIQTYVSACHSANATVNPWRQNSTCRMDCPVNSHYELCGTDCGHTCASSTEAVCERTCSEGCFCDEGFMRSGGLCVSVDQCGCLYDGFYFHLGEQFWTPECSQHCECSATNELSCVSTSCSPSEECAVRNGQRGCYSQMSSTQMPTSISTTTINVDPSKKLSQPSATCSASGDPHYTSFDGSTFDFQGTCRYILATVCNDTQGLPYFHVSARNEPWNKLPVSITVDVYVIVSGYMVHMSRNMHGAVKVDNETRNLPVLLDSGRVSIYSSGMNTFIMTDFGLSVSYDGSWVARITVPGNYSGTTCGLCGNYNGQTSDDFLTSSGALETSASQFGASWRVEKDTVCSDGCGDSCSSCPDQTRAQTQCEIIRDRQGPFSFCQAYVDPQAYFNDCVFDVCLSGYSNDVLCRSIQTYVSACHSANATVYPWRQNSTCRMDCPVNSHYELCGTDCGHTCASSTDAVCERTCSEGCFCDEGFMRSGGLCVSVDQCGCLYDGFYFHLGEQFWTPECSQHCECSATNELSCVSTSCSPSEECAVRNGQRGCYSQMSSTQMPTTISTTTINVDPSKKLSQPSATCSASGDPHYTSFDGSTFDFQGTCRYILATVCNDTQGLPYFHVSARNEPWNKLPVSITVDVYVIVSGYMVHMSRNMHGAVKVDNETRNLPVLLDSGRVSIYSSGMNTFITTDFGLSVSYDGSWVARITVPGNYSGTTCGLCGNYNGQTSDDFLTSSGALETSASQFGASWRVENDTVCSDGCGDSCSSCQDQTRAQTQCEIIRDRQGPFSFCQAYVDPQAYFNDCVFDVCLSGYSNDVLCRSIQTYVSACHSANATVYPWRQNSTCRMDCPVNSHYELCGTDCGHTCASSTDAVCERTCSEGCFCDEGFMRSGGLCVSVDQCGCLYDGFYFHLGEQFWTPECSQHCECSATNELSCVSTSCSPSEECAVRNGQRGCYSQMSSTQMPTTISTTTINVDPSKKLSQPSATCSASGDPHYTSFDGSTFDFQGTCRYILATVCNDTQGLPYFHVSARNEPWNKLPVSITVDVYVIVSGYMVHMSRNMHGAVKVDNETRNLPVLLDSGRVSIYSSGMNTFITTDFGLSVSYDGSWVARITVPGNYSGTTCGLCGNYNGQTSDDFLTSSGALETSASQFGASWRVENDTVCSDGCGDSCSSCPDQTRAQTQCEIIRDRQGPFSFCQAYVDPQAYFNDCVFDVCLSGYSNDVLCRSIQTYVSACHSANATVYPWRQNSTCRMDCPVNSHYELCGTDCGHTCASSTDAVCERTCSEGCFCDEGFMRSGGLCVSVDQCGCLYDGFYFHLGEQFWTPECSQHCECSATNELSCVSTSCSPSEECAVRNGQRGCYSQISSTQMPTTISTTTINVDPSKKLSQPSATCSASGDPHYTSFDGSTFDFQGTCRYILATVCNDTQGLPYFHVSARNEPWNKLPVSITVDVYVIVSGYMVHMSRNMHGAVKVDNETRNLPVLLDSGRVSIYSSGMNTFITTDFGLSVSYDGSWVARITVPGNYSGTTCGLCGNYNGQTSDDFLTSSGALETSASQFGASWRVENDTVCSDGCGDSCSSCPDQTRAQTQCEIIRDRQGPFSFCQAYVDPQAYFNDCVFDVCLSGYSNDVLCRSIQTYVSACHSANATVYPWRQNSTCRMDCPVNSHYELCGTDCGHTCASSTDAVCERTCSEGCFCDEGFMRSGGLCVSVDQCGCLYDGFYFHLGEQFWTPECSQHCECSATNELSCVSTSCSPSEECAVRNGQRGCYSQISSTQMPTTISTTTINVDPSKKLSQPSATCSASGDPHYTSFDRSTFDFQGTCRYILATVCNDTQGLPYFHVSARNEPWNKLPVSITVDVYVIVSGYMVHMSRNMHGAVKVDNETRNLPVLLDSGRVSIYSSGMNTFITTDFGLSVSYDGSWVARITVPGNYSGTTCGLCGNYNGQTSDDFLTSSGALETSASQFGASWRVENDTVCSDGCGDSCSSCPDKTRAQTQCEIIRDRQGPFSFCQAYVDPQAYFNDCVFDVCLSGYSNDVLCRSIQTYVSACHSANATVYPWRQNSTCRMDCPVNSHYELCGTDCGHTCASSTDAVCERTCSEGCFCDEGFMRSGGLCVSVDQCGCLYDGLYFHLGEQFWTPECSQHCECSATNELSCVSTSCSPSEECAVRNGQRGCYSQMSTTQMPTSTSTITINALVDHCEEVNCTEDEWCGEMEGVHGCFCNQDDPRPNPETYDAVEVCDSSSGTMSLSRCQLFEAGFSVHTLHLSDPSCRGTVQNGRLVFHFDNDDHICGTNLTANGTHFIYENSIQMTFNSTESTVNRQNMLQLQFSCVYALTQTLTMDPSFTPLQSTIYKNLPGVLGMYQVRMVPYQDPGFTLPYNGSAEVKVDQRVYVGVYVQGVDSRQIATMIDSCWATPVNDRNYGVRWDLISKQCPNPKDKTVRVLQSGVSTTARFSFEMFVFNNVAYNKVFIHCSIHLCLLQNKNCAALCHPGHHHRAARSVDIHDTSSISMGPFIRTERKAGI